MPPASTESREQRARERAQSAILLTWIEAWDGAVSAFLRDHSRLPSSPTRLKICKTTLVNKFLLSHQMHLFLGICVVTSDKPERERERSE
jgi:hypothetical protein